jgi:hypothetical protein
MRLQRAHEALARLQEHGFIRPVSSETKGPRSPRWFVDPGHACDVAISQGFLQPMDSKGPVGDSGSPMGRLGDLYENAGIDGHLPHGQALIDALLLFANMHAEQDFGAYAGVNPRFAAGDFLPIEPGDAGPLTDHEVAAALPGWLLVTERAPMQMPECELEFLRTALPSLDDSHDAPGLRHRGKCALKDLKKARLVYHAYVVWQSDPRTRSDAAASPLYTLYRKDSWTSELETDLQRSVHDAVLESDTLKRADVFGDARGQFPVWHRSGCHRYLIPEQLSGRAVLLDQLRVRWWPLSEDCHRGLAQDQKRVAHWREKLRDFNPKRLRSRESFETI